MGILYADHLTSDQIYEFCWISDASSMVTGEILVGIVDTLPWLPVDAEDEEVVG